eukprot:Awhi_evm1s10576
MCSRPPPTAPCGVPALQNFIGIWKGKGDGFYPTIEPFSYLETLTFSHVGKPFIKLSQKTKSPTNNPMHAEECYIKINPKNKSLEGVVCDPTGLSQTLKVSLEKSETQEILILSTTQILQTPSAKPVEEVVRKYTLDLEIQTITFEMSMKAMEQEFQPHLKSKLVKQAVSLQVNELKSLIEKRSKDLILVDVRERDEILSITEIGSLKVHRIPMGELMRDFDNQNSEVFRLLERKEICLICTTGVRAKLCSETLFNAGYKSFFLKGGSESLDADKKIKTTIAEKR